jgi:hypothetical protein
MFVFWFASVLFLIVLALLFRTERGMLAEGRARRRALVLDGLRLAIVAVMFLVLPAAEPRPLATIGLGLAILGFVAVPTKWMVAIGGVDAKWDLRPAQAQAAELMARYPSPMPPEGAAAMENIVLGLDRVRSRETAELCDLLKSRYGDWIEGTSRPLDQARRSVRIYDLQRELYGDDVRPTLLDEREATFRWHLYRLLGAMSEAGVARSTPEQRACFAEAIKELDGYRRDDTAQLIDVLKTSGRAWLRSRSRKAWQTGSGPADAESAIEEARLRLWPSTSVFWGAILDEADRRRLAPLRESGQRAEKPSEAGSKADSEAQPMQRTP